MQLFRFQYVRAEWLIRRSSLAYAEMRLIMARLLWNFDISLSEESLKWDDQRSYSIWQKEPLMIRLARARH